MLTCETREDALSIAKSCPAVEWATVEVCELGSAFPDVSDLRKIFALYDALHEPARSPVVALNRAVAVWMACGPTPTVKLVDALCAEGRLHRYHLLASAREDLLERLGRLEGARAEYPARRISLLQCMRARSAPEASASTGVVYAAYQLNAAAIRRLHLNQSRTVSARDSTSMMRQCG